MTSKLRSFYRSSEWLKFREIILLERAAEDGTLYCEYSGAPIVYRYDAVVHHKTELTDMNVDNPHISLNPDNVMVVSFKSHNKIHERFGCNQQKVYLVYGAPCSGKSSWVAGVAYPDDLIVDLDSIWCAVCGSDKYHKPNRLKPNVFALRDTLIDQVRCRMGMWRNAYVIGGYPLACERERLQKLLGAVPVFIDVCRDVCLSRCTNDEWRSYVAEWFDLFTP